MAASEPNSFTVDLADNVKMAPAAGYLIFTLDRAYSPLEVSGVRLLARTADDISAAADQSGEVWLVEAFTGDELVAAVPALVGAAPVGPDLGPVLQNELVAWDLPVATVASTDVYLSIVPLTTNGTDYLDVTSSEPPRLEIVLNE